jgi:hypothetical protein
MAMDNLFEKVIAQQTSGLQIAASKWTAGDIDVNSINLSSTVISAQSYLALQIAPATAIDASEGSQITIDFGYVLTPQSSCEVLNPNVNLNKKIACSVTNNIFSLSNAFVGSFESDSTLKFSVGPLTNPISV